MSTCAYSATRVLLPLTSASTSSDCCLMLQVFARLEVTLPVTDRSKKRHISSRLLAECAAEVQQTGAPEGVELLPLQKVGSGRCSCASRRVQQPLLVSLWGLGTLVRCIAGSVKGK